LGGEAPFIPSLIFTTVMIIIIIATGIRYFRSTEKTFADMI
jgi:hypothetical protein